MMTKNIGFISTCLTGTDDISLAADKWSTVLEKNGNRCFWFAGELGTLPQDNFLVPEAHCQHAPNMKINRHVFGKKQRDPEITNLIHTMRSLLKTRLYRFIDRFQIEILIAENVLSSPAHIPLGLALVELIAERQIATIAHHHHFYWEKDRFSTHAVGDYLRMAFPPNLPSIKHVVNHPDALEELAQREGIFATLMPHVIDFDHPPQVDENHCRAVRGSIGLASDEKMVLQPTQNIHKKEIEQAIELVQALKDKRYKLVITHETDADRFETVDSAKKYASGHGVDLHFIKTDRRVDTTRDLNRPDIYSIGDVNAAADLITYSSLRKGFGYAFLEAMYYKKPILINHPGNAAKEVRLRRFDLMVGDNALNQDIAQQVKAVIESPLQREQMVNHNYRVAAQHYSYHLLKERLLPLIT